MHNQRMIKNIIATSFLAILAAHILVANEKASEALYAQLSDAVNKDTLKEVWNKLQKEHQEQAYDIAAHIMTYNPNCTFECLKSFGHCPLGKHLPLHFAAERGYTEKFLAWIKFGINILSEDEERNNALMIVAKKARFYKPENSAQMIEAANETYPGIMTRDCSNEKSPCTVLQEDLRLVCQEAQNPTQVTYLHNRPLLSQKRCETLNMLMDILAKKGLSCPNK